MDLARYDVDTVMLSIATIDASVTMALFHWPKTAR
jgi:hypothetical protein